MLLFFFLSQIFHNIPEEFSRHRRYLEVGPRAPAWNHSVTGLDHSNHVTACDHSNNWFRSLNPPQVDQYDNFAGYSEASVVDTKRNPGQHVVLIEMRNSAKFVY
jgi:hypothetical protein